MSGFVLGRKSLAYLSDVHPDLKLLAVEALKISKYDFGITCGMRTAEQQQKEVDAGRSTTSNSRHLTGHAIDFVVYVNGSVTWDIKYYRKVIQAFVTTAINIGVQVEFGGLWSDLVDGPHIELNWKHYSKKD